MRHARRPRHANAPPAQTAPARALRVLRLMREGRSLTAAARAAHIDPRTARRYIGGAMRRTARRYVPARSDTFPRMLRFVTPDGVVALKVRSSLSASRIARYWTAVDHYLRSGDTQRLRAFRGNAVRTGKLAYPFITDPRTLDRLAQAGEVRFEELYVLTA